MAVGAAGWAHGGRRLDDGCLTALLGWKGPKVCVVTWAAQAAPQPSLSHGHSCPLGSCCHRPLVPSPLP